MMRKILFITGCVAMGIVIVSCNKPRRSTGRAYMPDMYYSRAYETYAALDTSKFITDRNEWNASKSDKIFYSMQPVTGTVARGEMPAYALKNDSTGYNQSQGIKNPLNMASIDAKEAERLYLVNCAVCHGAKLDGNGPLWKNGDGPYPAAPKNLLGDDIKAMSEGRYYHVMTFGKGQMGSYASQLTTNQRWMIATWIKSKQSGTASPDSAGAQGARTDTVAANPSTK
jgi:mono/diheme cytochrome c family protein